MKLQFNQSFATPTISSVNKLTQAPAHLRDKIKKLSVVVDQLKMNVQNQDLALENIEKSHQKNFENVSLQINTLRKAINTLADVVMDEIEATKLQFRDQLEGNCSNLRNMYQELSIKVAQIEDFKANEYFEIQKGMDAKYQEIDRTCNTFKADIITMLDEEKTDN